MILTSSIQIRKLQSFYNAKKQKSAMIPPAYQWAEGIDEVALNIKLAHKWDAPATLGCNDLSVNFTDTSMQLLAKWLFWKRRVMYSDSTGNTYYMNIHLHAPIIPANCTWSRAAVSRVVVNMKKAERGKWKSLLSEGYTMPRNSHKWYSMQDQLDKADKERVDTENVMKRLEERKREKELREEEDRRMEERRHRKKRVD